MTHISLWFAYQLARTGISYSEFESIIKSKLTGIPSTAVIEGDVIIKMKL